MSRTSLKGYRGQGRDSASGIEFSKTLKSAEGCESNGKELPTEKLLLLRPTEVSHE